MSVTGYSTPRAAVAICFAVAEPARPLFFEYRYVDGRYLPPSRHRRSASSPARQPPPDADPRVPGWRELAAGLRTGGSAGPFGQECHRPRGAICRPCPLPARPAPIYCPPMDGDVLRRLETGPARESDLDDVVRVLEAADGALGLPPEPIREELTWLWHLPSVDLERDARILRDGDGRYEGHASRANQHRAVALRCR